MNVHLQLKELEEKPSQQVQQSFSYEKSNERKTWSTHTPVGVMTYNRRVLKSSNHQSGSHLTRGTESLGELRRKHDTHNRGGVENSLIFPSMVSASATLVDEKVSGARQIDPSKAYARVTRSIKPRAGSRNRNINKEQVQKVKERDVNTRVWSR